MKTFIVYQLRDSREESPFYIGKTFIGSSRYWKHLTCYRSKARVKKKIKSLLDSYVIPVMEILYTTESEVIALRVEEYLIMAFGRMDQGLGPLLNHTDGGEGTSGRLHSEYTRNKISETRKGKYTSGDIKQAPGGGSSRLVTAFSKEGNRIALFLSGKDASDQLGLTYSQVADAMRGRSKICTHPSGEIFRFVNGEILGNIEPLPERAPPDFGKRVYQYNIDGSFVREYRSIRKAACSIGCCHKNLIRKITAHRPHEGFIWRYEDDR